MSQLTAIPTNKSFWDALPKPIVGLAPMDGYTDSAFRRVCKFVNPDIITVTEFTSADGLHYNAKSVKKRLQFDPSEQPVIAQIFGKNTETFVTATKLCTDMGFSGIDLNMGCPAKKVVRSEHGVALRKNHDLACDLIHAVANATHLPVSVKTRLGWTDSSDLIEFGQKAEQAGANMICIHGRTYQEPYKCAADWQPIYDLKASVSIPVLGNGGITSYDDGMRLCGPLDGFLTGQATFGNPWALSPDGPPSTFKEKSTVILNHAQWLIESKGERIGTQEIRKHLLAYAKGFHCAKYVRQRLAHIDSMDDVIEIIHQVCEQSTHVPAAVTA